jgi:C4-dicarboxylate transporter/malic acid transport protein
MSTSAESVRATRVRTLHPGWFASVMGTAVLAVITATGPGEVGALEPFWSVLAVAFLTVATGLAVALGWAYAVRWTVHRDAALADLRNPVTGPLVGSVPGGLLVLSAAYSAAGPLVLPDSVARGVATALVLVGAPLALFVGVVWADEVVDTAPIPLASITGTWFLPPVIAVLVPLAMAPLLPSWPEPGLWLAFGYALVGAGLILYLLVAGLVVARLAMVGPPPPPLAPAVWIALGPPGAGGVALLRLADAAPASGVAVSEALQAATLVLATALLGFGLWWLAFAALVLRRQRRRGPVPYTPAWWAWTFPLGALTALTLALGRLWGSSAVTAGGMVLLVATITVWLLVAARTVQAVRSGAAWTRHG